MAIEPAATSWNLPDPRSAGHEDVVAVGGDLSAGTILSAYRRGMFPMHRSDGRLAWWSPLERGVVPLDGLRVSRSLRKSMRRYRISVDREPQAVVDGCADPSRPRGWINDEIRSAYLVLFDLGWMHTIETWDTGGRLAGGLYGIGIGGFFGGESMFSRQTDASKSALVHLVELLSGVPGALLDVQWATPHLESLGALVMSRDEYLTKLPAALAAPSPWG
jgi:leucyl/phenylalanyl-tRNA--protein transferase